MHGCWMESNQRFLDRVYVISFFFFFSSRRRHTRFDCDWSSDVCSSDLVPQAVLSLKQGFGRLIRAKTDRGVLALLDTRLQRMPYGKIFLESLPRYGMTHELTDVAHFLDANGTSGRLGAKSASPS